MMLFYVESLFCGCQINTEEYFNLKRCGVKGKKITMKILSQNYA